MKNKLLGIVLVAVLSMQLIGCSSDTGNKPELSVESSSNSSTLDAKDDNSNDEDIHGEREVVPLVSEYLLPHEDSEEYLYVVDEDGEYAGKYNYQEITDIAEENGYPILHESKILAESAGIFFYYYIEYLDPDDHRDSITHIWAIDMNSKDFD